jgi:uncharacterized phage protein gp47/JayE
LRSELGITKLWFGKVFLRVLATVQAAKIRLLYTAIAKVQKNIFADTADPESAGGTLSRFGLAKLSRNSYPATAGIYTIDVTGETGGEISEGAQYKSNINSTSPDKLFIVETGITLTGTSGQVVVRALEAGTDAALVSGDEIELTAPIENIDSLATVDTIDTTPISAETTEEYREKIMQSFQLEPEGGAATDFRLWSLDVNGVRTSYVYMKNGETYATQVYVEALPDDSEPTEPDGVPPASMLSDVEDVIELDPDTTKPLYERGRRPMGTFNLEVLAVIPVGVTVQVYDLTDDSPAVLAQIEQACIDLFYTIRPYIAGADGSSRNDTLYLSQIITAIVTDLNNEVFFSNVKMIIDSTEETQYDFGLVPATYGNYPYLELLEDLTT